MKAFPGFEDQAAFPIKLNEALDLLVGKATDGKQGYKTDIEPWFGGQLGVSVGPLPAAADPAAARAVAFSVKDAAKATAWAAAVAARAAPRPRPRPTTASRSPSSLPPAPARTRRA